MTILYRSYCAAHIYIKNKIKNKWTVHTIYTNTSYGVQRETTNNNNTDRFYSLTSEN